MNTLYFIKAIKNMFSDTVQAFCAESYRKHKKRVSLAHYLNPTGNSRQWLKAFHQALNPPNYIEIGIATGKTLSFVNQDCRVIGVDPAPKLQYSLPGLTTVFAQTSDSFFSEYNPKILFGRSVSFAYVDGLHEYRQTARDIINILPYCDQKSLILVHDVVPPDEKSADPQQKTRLWPGDVYKTLPFLARVFPKLQIYIIRTYPTGLAVLKNIPNVNSVSSYAIEQTLPMFDELSVSEFHKNWLNYFINITETPSDLTEAIKEHFGNHIHNND